MVKPTNRRVRAQRKFAQGVYVPPSIQPERKPEQPAPQAPADNPVYGVNLHVTDFLNFVSLYSCTSGAEVMSWKNSMDTSVPVVVLERLSKTISCEELRGLTSAHESSTNTPPPPVASSTPKMNPEKRSLSQSLRTRILTRSWRNVSAKKRDGKAKVIPNKSIARRRQSEASIDDNRPLQYFVTQMNKSKSAQHTMKPRHRAKKVTADSSSEESSASPSPRVTRGTAKRTRRVKTNTRSKTIVTKTSKRRNGNTKKILLAKKKLGAGKKSIPTENLDNGITKPIANLKLLGSASKKNSTSETGCDTFNPSVFRRTIPSPKPSTSKAVQINSPPSPQPSTSGRITPEQSSVPEDEDEDIKPFEVTVAVDRLTGSITPVSDHESDLEELLYNETPQFKIPEPPIDRGAKPRNECEQSERQLRKRCPAWRCTSMGVMAKTSPEEIEKFCGECPHCTMLHDVMKLAKHIPRRPSPVPSPEPQPSVEPSPEPTPESQLSVDEPIPEPTPESQPSVQPSPEPIPEPTTDYARDPTPEPTTDYARDPTPDPTPDHTPDPEPERAVPSTSANNSNLGVFDFNSEADIFRPIPFRSTRNVEVDYTVEDTVNHLENVEIEQNEGETTATISIGSQKVQLPAHLITPENVTLDLLIDSLTNIRTRLNASKNNSSEIPSTNSSEIPSTSSFEIPSTSSSEIPSTSSSGIPSTSSSGIPSTSFSEIPSTSSSEIPSTSYSEIPSTSSVNDPDVIPESISSGKRKTNSAPLEFTPKMPKKAGKKTRFASKKKAKAIITLPEVVPTPPAVGIVEAPTFYPTAEDMKMEFIRYVERIAPEASKYGICKITIPPEFHPPCILKNVQFKSNNQYVSSMYDRWGSTAKEMTAIKAHLATQNVPFARPPLFEGMEVDLVKLYHLVQRHGGLRTVIEQNKWGKVAEDMNLNSDRFKAHLKLDKIYIKHLVPYDTLTADERDMLLCNVEDMWRKRWRKMTERAANPLHRSRRMLGESDSSEEESVTESDQKVFDPFSETEDCVVCGQKMTLTRYRKVADQVEQMHFPKGIPTTKIIEYIYWQRVLRADEHVCVYSASLDTSADGLGFPSDGTRPWNLKRLGESASNVLSALGPTLSATVPALHLSMLFSTNCWHMDPHHLPWTEYMHSGPEKIWYGIPAEQGTVFRTAVEQLCPTVVQNKSIWLPSDITMIPPQLLVEKSVSLSRLQQKPGDYVIVFPRAYSCSISTGFAVSESLYFATENWLDHVASVFQELRENCEPAMFSLEQLAFGLVKGKDPERGHRLLIPILTAERDYRLEAAARGLQLLTPGEMLTRNRRLNASSWQLKRDECDICRTTLFCSKMIGVSAGRTSLCLKHGLQLQTRNPRPVDEVVCILFVPDDDLKFLIDY